MKLLGRQPKSRDSVFVSWSGNYALRVAQKLQETIEAQIKGVQCFVSARDIGQGSIWSNELRARLIESSFGVVLWSQDAARSDWVTYEASILSTKTLAPRIYLLKAPESSLPVPLRHFQVSRWSAEAAARLLESVATLARAKLSPDVVARFGVEIEALDAECAKGYVTAEEIRWAGNMGRSMMFAEANLSPFDLEQALGVAEQHVVIIAQNHRTISAPGATSAEKHWPIIQNCLRRGVNVDIIGMHEETSFDVGGAGGREAAVVWAGYQRAPRFSAQLVETWATFEQWHARFRTMREREAGVGTLGIYGAPFLPISMKIIDPELKSGFMVISLRMGHESAANRPETVVYQRENPKAFAYYWHSTKNGFDNGGWRRMFR